jgi:hypothetical protein
MRVGEQKNLCMNHVRTRDQKKNVSFIISIARRKRNEEKRKKNLKE